MKKSEHAPIFCTVITKNHLAYARVLAASIHKYHPHASIFTLVVDDDKYVKEGNEAFTVIPLAALNIQAEYQLRFQYTAAEMSRILKPFLLQYLLEHTEAEKILYFDSDILITDDLTPVFDLLETHDITFTPHITKQLPPDDQHPSEQDILQAGTYNGGFIGVRNSTPARKFATWWGNNVRNYGFLDFDHWKSADQKWLTLAPELFPTTHVLAEAGYNTAYWNIPTHTITHQHSTYTVDGKPLRFFHFSGYFPLRPNQISSHQDRISFRTHPQLKPLFNTYRQQLLTAGYADNSKLPYAYDYFDNGVRISPVIRRLYHTTKKQRVFQGDPFQTNTSDSFFTWLTKPARAGSAITNLHYHIYTQDPDAMRTYPDVFHKNINSFLSWLTVYGTREFHLDPELLQSATTIKTKSRIPLSLHIRALWQMLDQHPLYTSFIRRLQKIRNWFGNHEK